MMSFFKNFFKGADQSQKPTLNPTTGLEKLEENADMIRKKIAHLQSQYEEQEKIARTFVTTNKQKALAALKQKKKIEENIRKYEGTLENIESQKDMLENASSNAAVLKTMSETAKIVKQQHDNLDINKVEDIVDEMREQKEISEEISNILSNTQKVHDDDELLKELENMQQEQIDEKLLQTDKDPTVLPSVPKQLPAQPQASSSRNQEAEDELEKLKSWAAAQ